VSHSERFKVFSMVYGVAYMAMFFHTVLTGNALVWYYPLLGGFRGEPQPLQEAGQPILWYSWLFGATVISVVAALLVPRSWAARVPGSWVWGVPLFTILGILVYERRWFY
jgi:hypothetical protein